MKAFFVISTHLGGAEKSLLDLVSELYKEKVPLMVVLPKKEGPLIDSLNTQGIPYKILPLPNWILSISRKHRLGFLIKAPLSVIFFLGYFFKLKKFVRQNKVKVIHSTGLKYHFVLGLFALWEKRIFLVIHLRDIVHNKWILSLFNTIAKNPKVRWISNSKATAESISPIVSKVIYNGFPLKSETEQKGTLKQELGLEEKQSLIGIVGAIARWKGQREFIEMARILIERGHDYHFVIVGDEIYDTKGESGELIDLRNRVQKLNLEKRVHFIGFQKNIENVYRSLDVLVHASIKAEPFGRVIVEAMAEGLPVTASSLGGPLEIIKSQENGLRHKPGDVKHMADNVVNILESPQVLQKIVAMGKKRALDFSMESHLREVKQVL